MTEKPELEEILNAIVENIEDNTEKSVVELYLKNPDKVSKTAKIEAIAVLKRFLSKYPEIAEIIKRDERNYEVLANQIKIGSDYEIKHDGFKSEISIFHEGVLVTLPLLITRTGWDALREYIRHRLDTKQFDKYSFTKKIQQMYHQAKQGDKKCLTEEIIFENFK
jgi:hypothetical protein